MLSTWSCSWYLQPCRHCCERKWIRCFWHTSGNGNGTKPCQLDICSTKITKRANAIVEKDEVKKHHPKLTTSILTCTGQSKYGYPVRMFDHGTYMRAYYHHFDMVLICFDVGSVRLAMKWLHSQVFVTSDASCCQFWHRFFTVRHG